MVLDSYKVKAEDLFRNYVFADSQILYTSVIGGICACKTVYDLSKVVSEFYFKSYLSLTKSQKIEWNNRVISTFHAIFITAVSIYFVFISEMYSDGWPAGASILQHSLSSTFSLGVSVGYFLSDIGMIFWFYPSLGGMEYVIHHLLAMVALMYAMLTGEGQVYTFMVLMSEATTPAVNLRWYLDVVGMKNSRLYVLNGMTMFISWLGARIVLFMYLLYHIVAHYDQVKQMQRLGRYLILIVPSVLAIMNFMWFMKIIRGLRKTLVKRQ